MKPVLVTIGFILTGSFAFADTCYTVKVPTGSYRLEAVLKTARSNGLFLEARTSSDTVHGYVLAPTAFNGNLLPGGDFTTCLYDEAAQGSDGSASYPSVTKSVYSNRKNLVHMLLSFFNP